MLDEQPCPGLTRWIRSEAVAASGSAWSRTQPSAWTVELPRQRSARADISAGELATAAGEVRMNSQHVPSGAAARHGKRVGFGRAAVFTALPSDRAKGDSASGPVSNPVSKPRVLDGRDVQTRRSGSVTSSTTVPTKEDPHGCHGRKAGGQHRHPAVHDRDPRGGARGPAGAHRGHALAREGDRRGSVAGRAAGDDAGARALLGDRVRLAQVRGEAERRTRSSSPRSTGWTSTSSTFAPSTRTRCRSSSATDGPARSSSR